MEALEGRVVPAGTWANLAASGSGPSSGGGAMMLLSDGSILIQNGSNPPPSASFFKLSPQANTGSYVNGSWSGGGTMNEARLFFSTVMMPNGNVFAVGGEYPKFSNTAEVYNSITNSWSYVDSAPTLSTNIDLSGGITGASNTSPITITTASTQQLQNGFQVTIAGVGGNTAANGTFTVANLTSTSFQLVGSLRQRGELYERRLVELLHAPVRRRPGIEVLPERADPRRLLLQLDDLPRQFPRPPR